MADRNRPRLLVQCRVDAELGDWIIARAKREGMTVATWVRSLLAEKRGQDLSGVHFGERIARALETIAKVRR